MRWWTYQKERFPLSQYLPMMLAFGFSGISFSMHLGSGGRLGDLSVAQYVAAGLVVLTFFMLMRIADEHKDFEEDGKFRPYRPVQRGLVKLSELRIIGVFIVILQIGLSIWVGLPVLGMLAIVYIWFILMTAEFFVPVWLKKRHTLYLISHMMILPLLNLYVTSIEWLPRGGTFSFGLLAYMVSSFCDGTVVEVGRKLRAKEDEEYGVDTYTQIWGAKRSMIVWAVVITASYASTVFAGFQVGVGLPILAILFPLYVIALFFAHKFAKDPSPKNAKFFKVFPGTWMFLMYFMLGGLPFFVGVRA